MQILYLYCVAAYGWICGSSCLTWSEGWWPSGCVLHSSDVPGELPHWPCHDDSTINTVMSIAICIITTLGTVILAIGFCLHPGVAEGAGRV